nr:ATP-grasp domain-containing protein [Microvirga tunisiensis]
MGVPSKDDPLVLLTPTLRAGFEGLSELGYDPIAPFEQPVTYGLNSGFVQNAGRRFITCKHDVEDIPEEITHLPLLNDVARSFIGQKISWKMLSEPLKEYRVQHFIPTREEPLPEEITWAAVHRGAGISAIQEFVEMEQEYRCFVVDGRVVSGAGAVVEYTPLNRTAGKDEIFDYVVRGRIGDRTPPEASIVVSAYRDAAQEIVDEILAADSDFPRHFVMDLFAAGSGGNSITIGIVELNPLGRSGFFANDPHRIADALLTWLKSNPAELTAV